MSTPREPITEDWLKSVGFKWHQVDRQPSKHWCLWLGACLECPADGEDDRRHWRFSGDDDFGLELCYNAQPAGADPDESFWFCWFRADSAGRYHRFLHVRHIRWQHEIVALVEAIGGRSWNPDHHWYGSVRCARHSAAIGSEQKRIDHIANAARQPWYESEKDETRDRALPEHLDEAIKSGRAK